MTKERVGKTEKTQPNHRLVTQILKQVQNDKGRGRMTEDSETRSE